MGAEGSPRYGDPLSVKTDNPMLCESWTKSSTCVKVNSFSSLDEFNTKKTEIIVIAVIPAPIPRDGPCNITIQLVKEADLGFMILLTFFQKLIIFYFKSK